MIRFKKPTLKRKDMDCVLQTMVDEEIGSGSRAGAFVQSFCEKTGSYIGTAFRSYPDSLKAGLKVLGAEQGTKVALSALSPSVYLDVLSSLGCEPVIVDVEKENACPIEQQVFDSRAEILMLYEPEGSLPMKYNSQTTYAEKADYGDVRVLEDITTSIGGHVLEDAKAGDWGKAVVCSFEESDTVAAGGGAILAVRSTYASELRSNRPDYYHSMTDLNASLGTVQLENLEENSIKRRDMVKTYQQGLQRTEHRQFGLQLIDYESNGAYFSVFLNSKPDEIIEFAKKHDVPVLRTFEKSVCASYSKDPFEVFPVAAAFCFRTVSFPIYPFLKDADIDIIKKVLSHLP